MQASCVICSIRGVVSGWGTGAQKFSGCILYKALRQIENAGELKRVYVRPAFRKPGLAQPLLDGAEQFAVSLGISCLYLDTKGDLRATIAFYERNGYSRCERYNDNPQATIFMRKRLAA